MIENLILKGSFLLVFVALVGAGVGIPISEDGVVVTCGALAQRGMIGVPEAMVSIILGILVGDMATFFIARKLGQRFFDRPLFQKLVPPLKRARAELFYEKYGGGAVFLARFMIGFRLPAFATAGVMGVSPWKFIAFDLLGALITAPLAFSAGYFFSDRLDEILAGFESAGSTIAALVGVALLILGLVWLSRRLRGPKSEEL